MSKTGVCAPKYSIIFFPNNACLVSVPSARRAGQSPPLRGNTRVGSGRRTSMRGVDSRAEIDLTVSEAGSGLCCDPPAEFFVGLVVPQGHKANGN